MELELGEKERVVFDFDRLPELELDFFSGRHGETCDKTDGGGWL